LGLSANSLVQKLTSGRDLAISSRFWTAERDTLNLAPYYYAQQDYTIVKLTRADAAQLEMPKRKVALKVLGEPRFGEVLPEQVTVDRPTLVSLNVALFPWNQLYLDGKPVPPGDLVRDDYLAALQLEPGHRQIDFKFQPDRLWVYFRTISWMLFLFLALGSAFRFRFSRVRGPAKRGLSK
jgi:hypothetical protein